MSERIYVTSSAEILSTRAGQDTQSGGALWLAGSTAEGHKIKGTQAVFVSSKVSPINLQMAVFLPCPYKTLPFCTSLVFFPVLIRHQSY